MSNLLVYLRRRNEPNYPLVGLFAPSVSIFVDIAKEVVRDLILLEV